MVTRILLDPRRDLPGGNGFTSDPIVLEATPTSIREDGSVFVLPTTLSFTVNTAADVVQLPPPAASWAWRLVARQDGVPVQQRTVRFPDVPSIGYGALTDVDPASLGETRGHARQWDATFFQIATLIGTFQGQLDALTAGAPTAFNTFLEIANQIGLDETTTTALQALVAGKANVADVTAQLAAKATADAATYPAFRSTPPDHSVVVAYIDTSVIPPVLKGWNGTAWVALTAIVGGAVSTVDNGDGTFTATGSGVTDNGDGTFTINDSTVTANADGTFTLAA